MSKKMPPHVKGNFLYRKIWNDIYEKSENAVILFIGNVGQGKSTQAIKLGSDLDENFCVEQIVYSIQEFNELVRNKKIKRGSFILFDEIAGSEDNADARSSLSKQNKVLSYITTTIRSKGYIIGYVAPMISQIDKRPRVIGVKAIIRAKGVNLNTKTSKAWVNWVILDEMNGNMIRPRPAFKDESGITKRVKFLIFHLPKNKQLLIDYKKKKSAFQEANSERWAVVLQKPKKISLAEYYDEAVKILPQLVTKTGGKSKVLHASLCVFLKGISEKQATMVRATLQSQIDAGSLKVPEDSSLNTLRYIGATETTST